MDDRPPLLNKATTSNEDWISVGRVKDAHHLKGAVYIVLRGSECEWLDRWNEAVFAKDLANSSRHVFKVTRKRRHKQGLIVELEGITSRTQAEGLKGLFLLLPSQLLESEAGETPFLAELFGHKIQNSMGEELGTLSDFYFNGAQDIAVIKGDRGVAEVPFVKPLVVDIRYDQKVTIMDFSEDLWNLDQK